MTWKELSEKVATKMQAMDKKAKCQLFHKLAKKWHPEQDPKHAYVRVTDVLVYGVQPRRFDIISDVQRMVK